MAPVYWHPLIRELLVQNPFPGYYSGVFFQYHAIQLYKKFNRIQIKEHSQKYCPYLSAID